MDNSKYKVSLLALSAILALAMVSLVVSIGPKTAEAASSEHVKMYRLYNQYTGEHFYTASETEKNNCANAGWTWEGAGWYAPKTSEEPVYRLYNPYVTGGDHHYTRDKAEYDRLVKKGWSGEDVGWYSEPASETDRVAIYRQYNPNAWTGTHNFTKDKSENDSLVNAGWKAEGEAWYGVNYTDTSSLYLGSFFTDTSGPYGFNTVLCTSRDGVGFEKVSTPFTDVDGQNPFHDPSIMYKDGYFWVISNWNKQDGKFWPMFSYSKDLITWTQPEGEQMINGGSYKGISLESLPFGNANFDVVAPEWFVDTNGDTYIIFSAGYYGGNHNDPENDSMKVYAVKVNLTAGAFANWGWAKPAPDGIKVQAGTAFEIQGLDSSNNYIDSSVYKDGNNYYLITKKDGVNNQIYKNTSMSKSGWTRVNNNIALGNEGPSCVKADNTYVIYTDKIDTYHGDNGMQFSIGSSLTGQFSPGKDLYCVDKNGSKIKLRHGTVIKLTGDAKTVGESFRKSGGFSD